MSSETSTPAPAFARMRRRCLQLLVVCVILFGVFELSLRQLTLGGGIGWLVIACTYARDFAVGFALVSLVLLVWLSQKPEALSRG